MSKSKTTPSKVNPEYTIVKSLSAGSNSSYSYEKDGKKSVYGFDSKDDVECHIAKIEAGKTDKI